MDAKNRIAALIEHLQHGLLERETPARLALLAALSGEHLLLLGPPGTAKSELSRRLHTLMADGSYFERLLTRFSVPEELFGPLSIKALEQDRYLRQTQGYLPEASIAFIDEIFKANSAILNSLLTLLNERQFDNGNARLPVPLVSVIAASNELPEGAELNALYDRFLLRFQVAPVGDDTFTGLLTLNSDYQAPAAELKLTSAELTSLRKAAEQLPLSPALIRLLHSLRRFLAEQEIPVSDRRWRKVVKLLKVSACCNGQSQADLLDAWLLPHCLWQQPDQHGRLTDWLHEHIAADPGFSPQLVSDMVDSWQERLDQDADPVLPSLNEQGYQLYLDEQGQPVTEAKGQRHKRNESGQLLYRQPRLPDSVFTEQEIRNLGGNLDQYQPLLEDYVRPSALQPKAWPASHVASRLRQLDERINELADYLAWLDTQQQGLGQRLRQHLWLSPELGERARAQLEQQQAGLSHQHERLQALREAFADLPVEG
ncbi:AAA family ATPase [Oceanimonas sp. CAM02]|uniref:AAA family ATPase n=1 Tax=Oceanimonas sp. CAM02 TaxID=3080336 RepID=UPI0029353F29|nr:AAA family ATPase [Oceanimonas sp. CAM02]MDV2858090.1 AAA family ATPase [Oceanimonas sp. CAM02]